MVTFSIGQQYHNRKGKYKVIEIKGNSMNVRYDNGSEQILDISTQTTIFENIQREEMQTKSTKKPTLKPRNQQFYWSLGFLLARTPNLIAFIPQHALDSFKDNFYDATGQELLDNEKGITIHSPKTDKRWYELRVTFTARPNELYPLNFGDDVNIVEGSLKSKLWNINNNRFFLRLLEFNFSTGSQQDKTSIESAIPNQYLGSFKEGYSKGSKNTKQEKRQM